MRRHSARLDKLEQALQGPGDLLVLYGDDSEGGTGKVDPDRLAEARAELGPSGTLILVEYTRDWAGCDDTQV